VVNLFLECGLGAFMASQLKSEFNISNICMTPMEFKSKVETAEKNEVIIYDEAHRGIGSSSALSEVNKLLKDLMMEMGQRNLICYRYSPNFLPFGTLCCLISCIWSVSHI